MLFRKVEAVSLEPERSRDFMLRLAKVAAVQAESGPGRSRRRVWAGVLVTLAALAAAAVWAVTYAANHRERLTTFPSSATAVGTWEMEGGTGRIRLEADGRFLATGLDEVFTSDQSTTGSWTLTHEGRHVALVPGSSPSGAEPDFGLTVVETGGAGKLCVLSESPGVLCDFLLARDPG
jgi:hypothetical protein